MIYYQKGAKLEYAGEIREFLERGRDIGFFAKYICRCDTGLYNAGKSKYGDLTDDSLRWLRNSNKRENLLHAANRWFKSGSQAIKILHKIVYNDDDPRKYRLANVAISTEQSTVIFNKVLDLFQNSILPKKMLKSVTFHPQPTAVFYRYNPSNNFSDLEPVEFWARTTQNKGKYLEGFDFRYINFDEPAFERHLDFLRDEILLPRTGDYQTGQIDYTATPKGLGKYYQLKLTLENMPTAYVQGGRVAELVEPANFGDLLLYREQKKKILFRLLNPYISVDYIANAFYQWPLSKIKQVIYGEFISTASNPFAERIMNITNTDLRLLRRSEQGHRYVTAWDLARGRKRVSDKTVGITADVSVTPWRVVDHESFQLPWVEEDPAKRGCPSDTSVEGKIRKRAIMYSGDTIIDGTGIGDTMTDVLSDVATPFIFTGANREGMSKQDAILNAQTAMDMNYIEIPHIQELIDECMYYQLADEGLETDNVMALVILLAQADIINTKQSTKYIPA
jgi:hypothetical protein